MADAPKFTSAQRVAALQRRLVNMAEGFDGLLTHLVREPSIGEVYEELLLQDREGGGVVLRIQAEVVEGATLDAAIARHQRRA